jgi:hypothetical protein
MRASAAFHLAGVSFHNSSTLQASLNQRSTFADRFSLRLASCPIVLRIDRDSESIEFGISGSLRLEKTIRRIIRKMFFSWSNYASFPFLTEEPLSWQWISGCIISPLPRSSSTENCTGHEVDGFPAPLSAKIIDSGQTVEYGRCDGYEGTILLRVATAWSCFRFGRQFH